MPKRKGPTALEQWMQADPTRRTWTAVAEALGVTEQTVRNWVGFGVVPKEAKRHLLAILLGDTSLTDIGAWMTVAVGAVAGEYGGATQEDVERVRERAATFARAVQS